MCWDMAKRILCLALSIIMVIGFVAIALSARAVEETNTHYVVDAVRDGDTYIVTVKCNWTDYQMLNGEFRFTYPTDELELLLEDREHGPIDPANNLTPLPGAEVGVDTEKGEIRLAFISVDGGEFADGWVTMLVLPFRLLHEEVEDLNVQMETETLVAAGDRPGEKVDVLEETEIPSEIVFEKPVEEVPTTVTTTTTTTTTTSIEGTTTAPIVGPSVGAEYYTVKVLVADGRANVTVQFDYTNWYVLNGGYVFSYPTDKVDLVVPERFSASKMSALPSRAIRLEEELGEIHVAFMSTDGAEFLDGPVDALKLEFDILDPDAESFELVMQCNTLRAWEEENATGKDMLAAGILPASLRWNVSLEPTPTTTTTTTTTTTPPPPPKKIGDVNGDDKVDSTDARITLQRAVNKITSSALDMDMADVNGDNRVDSTDARIILQYAVNKISKFPVQ